MVLPKQQNNYRTAKTSNANVGSNDNLMRLDSIDTDIGEISGQDFKKKPSAVRVSESLVLPSIKGSPQRHATV